MRKTAEMMEGTHKRRTIGRSGEMSDGYDADFTALEQRVAKHYQAERVGQCVECRQPGELNHRGVCDFCDDPYGQSALASLLDLEEEILRGQE